MVDFHTLFEFAPDAYLVLRAAGDFKVVAANRACMRMLGLAGEQVIGHAYFDLFPAAAARLRPSLERAIATREPQLLDREPGVFRPPQTARPGLDPVFWRISHVPLPDPTGAIDRILQRMEDVTALVTELRRTAAALAETREQLHLAAEAAIGMRDVADRQAAAERERLLESERAARSEAERTSRLKDEFLATLSHELRTPLNAILGWTQVLKTPGLEPADLAQGLEVIDRNTRVQARLIEDLLDMSRIRSGKVRLDVHLVGLATIVNAAIDSVRTAAEAKSIHLTAVLERPEIPVMGDANRLQQVLWNLLTNSIKFTPPGGSIQVSVGRQGANAIVSVTDNGIGIPPEFLPHVFERFRQADASTTRQHTGLGLGLSIVKQLVELHGGEVRAESPAAGGGTTFTLIIPVVVPARPMEQPTMTRPRPQPSLKVPIELDLTGIRVLVVDDQPDSGVMVKRVLEGHHAEVHVALSMDEALDEFPRFKPQVLLSDIGMPQHDGYELIRRIRERPDGHAVPAAALTALARGEDRSRALEAGFTMHLSKPVEPAELLRVVGTLTGRSPSGNPTQPTVAS